MTAEGGRPGKISRAKGSMYPTILAAVNAYHGAQAEETAAELPAQKARLKKIETKADAWIEKYKRPTKFQRFWKGAANITRRKTALEQLETQIPGEITEMENYGEVLGSYATFSGQVGGHRGPLRRLGIPSARF